MNDYGFTYYDDDSADWHYPYGGYGSNQTTNMKLANEASELISNGTSHLDQLIKEHKTSDFYIREFNLFIDFDESLLDISDEILEEISVHLCETIHATNWMGRYFLINEVRNDGIEALLENSSLSEVIDLFINCYIDCGFELERSDLGDHFEGYDEAKEIISKRLMWEELKK